MKPRRDDQQGARGHPPEAESPSETYRPRRELRSDLLRYLPSQAIPAAISFFTIPILTRLFDPSEYGDYRLVLATVGVFGSAASWMASSIYRFYPEMEMAGEAGVFRSTVSRLLTFTSISFAAIWLIGLATFRPVIGRDLFVLFVIGLFLMVTNVVWSVANALVRAVREVTWYSIAATLNKALTLGLGVALVMWFGFRVDGLLYGSITASLVLLPLLAHVIRRGFRQVGRRPSRRLGRNMLRYGYPIALMQVASWLLQLSDRYIIAGFRGTQEVGLYSAAYGIAEQAMQVMLLMFQLPFAILGARVWERDGPEEAARFVSSSSRSYLLLAIPAWAGISALSVPLMTLMTDEAYREAATIMPLVSGALLLFGVQWWYSSASTFMKKTGQQAIAVIVGLVVNVGLNLVLVDPYGYQIAAVTTLVAYAAAMWTMIWLSRRDFRWSFPMGSVMRALVAAAVMAGAIFLLRRSVPTEAALELALAVPAGVIVYGAVLLGLREEEATRLLRRVLNRLRS